MPDKKNKDDAKKDKQNNPAPAADECESDADQTGKKSNKPKCPDGYPDEQPKPKDG